jgi:hypothetical protein
MKKLLLLLLSFSILLPAPAQRRAIRQAIPRYTQVRNTKLVPVDVWCGQSNSRGSDPASRLTGGLSIYAGAITNVNAYKKTTNTTATDGTFALLEAGVNSNYNDVIDAVGVQALFGAEITYYYGLKTYWRGPVYMVKYAVGGTALAVSSTTHDWNIASNDLYPNLKNRVLACIAQLQALGYTPYVRQIHWFQGESDTDTQVKADAYATNLTNFISTLRTDIGAANTALGLPKPWFIIGAIRADFPFAYAGTVRAAQLAVAATLASDRVLYYDTAGNYTLIDAQHFQQVQHGIDVYSLYKDLY